MRFTRITSRALTRIIELAMRFTQVMGGEYLKKTYMQLHTDLSTPIRSRSFIAQKASLGHITSSRLCLELCEEVLPSDVVLLRDGTAVDSLHRSATASLAHGEPSYHVEQSSHHCI